MLRRSLLAAGRSPRLREFVEHTTLTRPVVDRFVAGGSVDAALSITSDVVDSGRLVTLDHLGEDTTDREQAEATVAAYLRLLDALSDAGLAPSAEVSVKLSAVGQSLNLGAPGDGERIALDGARRICQAAANAGTTVTLDMEDHTTTDSTLAILRELRADFPFVGVALQAYLLRTEADCADLASAGSRVRLCKGAYNEPASVAYQHKSDVDRAYVRCMKVLMHGAGYPMLATHDPRLIAIGEDRARWFDRSADEFEFQMLYGVRPAEQLRLAAEGYTVRVYVPYGTQWYGYLMRRVAERPANLAFFLRALRSR
jgi:proline dehydrogenase